MDSGLPSQQLLGLILRPVVRFLVRRGVVFQEFDAKAREFFVQAAVEELRKTTEKINSSRVSVVTGLQRREVIKYMEKAPEVPVRSVSLTSRVLANWEQQKRFLTKSGTARVLRYDGENSEFSDLCASVSTAIHPGTLLFELQRIGLVKITPNGVKLVRAVEGSLHDAEKVYTILGQDLDLLFTAVDQNMQRVNPTPNHHIRTDYDNIYVDKVAEIREWILNEGRQFHRRVREYLARYDQDVNASKDPQKRAGARVAVLSAGISILPADPAPPTENSQR
ncbi:MAG: hypothetical protein J0M12_12070 [Deltaproteobacteria bacterium]|nr:hypothetical protein [Deltaproteobacteria bacterium]